MSSDTSETFQSEKSGGEISAEYADKILTVTVSLPSAETD